MKPRLTHVALGVRDLARSIDFYRTFARCELVHDRTEGDARVVWLSDRGENPDFVIVLFEMPLLAEAPGPGSLAHLGFAVTSRTEVDAIAARGHEAGVLVQGPVDAGPVVGYICLLEDPDGNLAEFSFGQPINPRELPAAG
jgi:catechol 2,3-dioxygenase-like lactoylglutathione lyase family enzyme